jgi:hypothetical protein
MSSSVQRRRRDCIRQVLDRARASGDHVAPWRAVAEVADRFADEADLLVELHREWLRLLVGRLHRGGIVPRRTPANVRDLHDEVAAEHPTLRELLDAHAAHPALWEPTAAEHAMLAVLAGLATHETQRETAAATGRALLVQRIPVQRGALG